MFEKDISTDVLPEFVPYRTNSNAPDGSSFLWLGSEVDVVLVSINQMNHENITSRSVSSPTIVLLHMCLRLSLPLAQ